MTVVPFLKAAQKWEPLIRRLLLGFLAILLGVILSRLFWVIVEPAGAVSQNSPLLLYDQGNAGSTIASVDTGLLTRINPFVIGDASSDLLLQDAPETTLNLKLVGERAPSDGTGGSATILTPDNKTQVFNPGDEVIPGVILDRILPYQVVLSRNGALETLRRSDRENTLGVLLRESDTPGIGIQDVIAAENTRPAVVQDGRALFQSLRIEPVFKESDITGYRLGPRDDGTLMRSAGLEPGDILVALDGDDISDLEVNDISDRMVNGMSVALTVQRQETTQTVSLTFGR